jgi:hypothetical protein
VVFSAQEVGVMTTERASSERLSIAQHPDIMALRERYERAAETPQAWVVEGLSFMAGVYAAISSWVLGFNGSAPSLVASNLVVGIAITMLAFGFAGFYARAGLGASAARCLAHRRAMGYSGN